MTKKAYMAPAATVTNVRLEQLLLSGSVKMSANPASTDGDDNYETLSRQHSSIWDDEED